MNRKMSELLMMAAIMQGSMTHYEETNNKPIIYIDKTPPIPKGCKEYFFNSHGEFSTQSMRKDECVFKCIALNDKSATKKFKNRNLQ